MIHDIRTCNYTIVPDQNTTGDGVIPTINTSAGDVTQEHELGTYGEVVIEGILHVYVVVLNSSGSEIRRLIREFHF